MPHSEYRPPQAVHHNGPPPDTRPPYAGPPPGFAPPARPPGVGGPPLSASRAPDFAAEKPQAYKAFVDMAVHNGEGGTTVGLPNSMCLDRHVPDFLACLECWLVRSFGQPAATQRPWRLQCLDLSRNSLSDASLCRVLETLKRLDVRIERLWLAGNLMAERGLVALTEYVWNCRDALVEVDVADSTIPADPMAGPEPGSDGVSAFLRCIYNHGAYPLMLDHGGLKVVPLLLKMGNNFISHPDKLLRMIRNKGGKSHVRICSDAEPYVRGAEKEYLSVCLPDFLTQKVVGNGGNGRVAAAPVAAPAPVAAAPPVVAHAAPAAAEGKRKKDKKDKKEGKEGKEKKRRKEGKEHGDAAAMPAVAALDGGNAVRFTEEEQRRLQSDIDLHLKTVGGLPGEENTRTMLSEFAVCMVVVKKSMQEIAEELVPFVGSHAKDLTQWLERHIEGHYPDLMSQLRA